MIIYDFTRISCKNLRREIEAIRDTIEVSNRELYLAKEEISRLKKENFNLKERLKRKVIK